MALRGWQRAAQRLGRRRPGPTQPFIDWRMTPKI